MSVDQPVHHPPLLLPDSPEPSIDGLILAGEVTPIEGVRDTASAIPGAAVEWGDPIDLPLGDEVAGLVVFHAPLFADPGRHHRGDVEDFLAWLIEVIDEAERVLEVGGRLVLVAKALESRRPYLDLAAMLIGPMTEAGFTVPVTYTWCTSLAAPEAIIDQPAGFDLTAAEALMPVSSWRVVVAGKGCDHRAGSILYRQQLGLPHRSTIPASVWDIARNDVWLIPTTGAVAQGALPPALVAVILSLFTFVDDLVINPLAGTPVVAEVAQRMQRRARCFEPDPRVLAQITRSLRP